MKRFPRRAAWALLAAGLIYIGVCAALLLSQNRLLYIGTVLPPHNPALSLPVFAAPDGTQLGWVAAPSGPARGTVVFFHGNDEEAWQAARNYAPYFTARGWRVVFPEYRGFDFRKGQHPTHDTVIADAITALRLAGQRYPGPLWIAGNSLGAGIAAQAAQAGGVGRVLLFVPWDSLGAVAATRYPFVPVRWLLRLDGTEYDSCAALKNTDVPVYIVYAVRDVIIPARHARHLARCLGLPQGRVIALPGASHLDWYLRLSPAEWNILLDGAQTSLLTPADRAKRLP